MNHVMELIKKKNPNRDRKTAEPQEKFIWCLIGNIVNQELLADNQDTRYGTKHFSANTKVYCFPAKWGDGYEKIQVIGRHRQTSRNVCIVMPANLITNWRIQKVYRLYILKVMKSKHGWTDSEKDKETILKMLEWLPKQTNKQV